MTEDSAPHDGRRLLRRDERRAQLVRAAARAFLRGGFAATSLDDIAAEAGVTKVIVYRHFDSKRELYVAVLQDTRQRILGRAGDPARDQLADLVATASEVPDGFRILYRHARREPEFAEYAAELSIEDATHTESRLHDHVSDPARRAWLAALLPAIVVDAILAWLDTGQAVEPDRVVGAVRDMTSALLRP